MLMWQHGEEAIAKALVAAKLYKALAHEAADDDLETEVYEELKGYAKEFEALGEGQLLVLLEYEHFFIVNITINIIIFSFCSMFYARVLC